jgi:hypothetical protein
MHMRTIILSAVCALGLALAASTGASAAPIGAALDGVNMSPVQEAQVVVVTPGHRHFRRVYRPVCRTVTRCRIGAYGRRVCRTERICRR